MNGRIEHGLKIDQKTQSMLETLPQCVTDYYYAISMSTEPHTRKEYITRIKAFLHYTNKNVEDICEKDITRYFHYINEKSKISKGKELSSSYLQLIWSSLNGFFTYLEQNNIIEKNPIGMCKYPKSKDRHSQTYLNENELKNTLNAVTQNNLQGRLKTWNNAFKERDFLILYMLMNTGMRTEMLCEINANDFDYKKMRFIVIAKGGKEIEYKITPQMSIYINQWMIKRTKYLNRNSGDALFISKNGERLTYISINRIVKKYTKMMGKEVTPHKLRASFITNFYEASGHDLEATRIAGGHEFIETTKRYIGGKEESRFDAQKYMDGFLK